MTTQFNGSSYYRANPFYQQGYIPDSAFKNRKTPSFMVEIPQGNQYFQPTNKKHFQRVGYYSTIADEGIINKDFVNSPARQKQYFRSLNVEDIEGTSTNTLISQAVKNKLKARQQLALRQREQAQLQAKQKRQYFQKMEEESKRTEALKKMHRKDQPNYHEKVMKLKTEESEGRMSLQPNYQQNNPTQKYHQQKYEKFKNQLHKTENQIKQLERQLRQGGNETNNKFRQQCQSIPTKQVQSQTIKAEHQYKNIRDLERDSLQVQAKYQQLRSFPNKNTQPFINENQVNPGRFSNLNLAQNSSKAYSMGLNSQNTNDVYSQQMQNSENRQRSYTDKPPIYLEQKNHQSYQDNNQEFVELQKEKVAPQTPGDNSRAQMVKQTREEHRRYNPTYLSYGSPAIGLAGRNIIGF